jgi:flagellar biosynthetic protein FliQ
MTPGDIMTLGHHALTVVLLILLVSLVPALVTGLLVSMFQAATQINEMTLSFIPKLLVTLGAFVVAGPWMLRVLVEYTRELIERIPYLIG